MLPDDVVGFVITSTKSGSFSSTGPALKSGLKTFKAPSWLILKSFFSRYSFKDSIFGAFNEEGQFKFLGGIFKTQCWSERAVTYTRFWVFPSYDCLNITVSFKFSSSVDISSSQAIPVTASPSSVSFANIVAFKVQIVEQFKIWSLKSFHADDLLLLRLTLIAASLLSAVVVLATSNDTWTSNPSLKLK